MATIQKFARLKAISQTLKQLFSTLGIQPRRMNVLMNLFISKMAANMAAMYKLASYKKENYL